jgi:hypothetical protein
MFPKGLLVGQVTKVAPGSDLFLNIQVRPAADLSKLEEVLVVTKIDERQAEPDQTGAGRAVDILAERLPGVPSKPADANSEDAAKTAVPGAAAPGTVAPGSVAASSTGAGAKPKTAPPHAPATSTAPVNSGAAVQKVVPKPVQAPPEPKPQPAAEDVPH